MANKAKRPKQTKTQPPKSKQETFVQVIWRQRQSRLVQFFALWLVPFLILESFFFTEVLKNYNYLEIFPNELAFPTFMHGFTALLIAILLFVVKSPGTMAAKLLIATVLGLFMVDYDARLMAVAGWFRALLPMLPQPGDDVAVISILFIALLVLLATWFGRWVEKMQKRYASLTTPNIVAGVFIVLGFVFVGQAIQIGRVLPSMMREAAVQPKPLPTPSQKPTSSDKKPDVYYIVFDRYTNNSVLREQFGFDNSPFTNYLQANGFSVDENASSNYPYTATSIASTMNGAYVDDLVKPFKDDDVHSRTLFHNLTRQSSVVKALKDAGYDYHSVGSTYGATNKAPQALGDYMSSDTILVYGKERKRLRGVEASQFKQSPYYRFTKVVGVPKWPVSSAENSGASYIRTQFNQLDALADAPEQGGRFILAHLLVPHDPFLFNANGSTSLHPSNDSTGRPVREKYIEQLQFVNNQIQITIDKILKNSNGEAVIMLIADEGVYPQPMSDTFRNPVSDAAIIQQLLTDDMTLWTDDWLKMKFGILEAARIPNATAEDLQQLSSVNAFRVILNRYAGHALDYLPQCHFAFHKGGRSEFNFIDITKRLSGADNPYCAEHQSLPAE